MENQPTKEKIHKNAQTKCDIHLAGFYGEERKYEKACKKNKPRNMKRNQGASGKR